MIRSHQEMLEYREADRIALRRGKGAWLAFDEVWKFQRLLRRVEYLMNCRKHRGCSGSWFTSTGRSASMPSSIRCGFDIPPNVSDPASASRTGVPSWCIRMPGSGGIADPCGRGDRHRPGPFDLVPTIGDNCYIGPGAKTLRRYRDRPNTAIGANSVVNKSFPEGT
jgi:serine O-acetyltransferase